MDRPAILGKARSRGRPKKKILSLKKAKIIEKDVHHQPALNVTSIQETLNDSSLHKPTASASVDSIEEETTVLELVEDINSCSSHHRQTLNKRRKKTITLQQLEELGPIRVTSMSTDLNEEESTTGPWQYNNSADCIVNFIMMISNVSYSMRLDNLLERGIPSTVASSLSFRWYSWIRFKSIAKSKNIPMTLALGDEKQFLYILKDVASFYARNPRIQKEEGLRPNRGPQSFSDATNVELLHYYGKGTLKYYRKTTFLQLVSDKYGENVKAEFLVNPTTGFIDNVDYEELLQEVNIILRRNYTRHLKKLQEYAGPQCNENRIDHSRVNYDVKFKSTSCSKSTATSVDQETLACNETDSDKFKETDFSDFYLRRCQLCKKVRWLGERAANKYVLGSYSYGGVHNIVQFSCKLLHNTSCDDEEDIMPLNIDEELPNFWVAYKNSQECRLPPAALIVRTLRPATEGIHDAEVIAKYNCANHILKDFNDKAICTKSINSAQVELGQRQSTGRFQRFREVPVLCLGQLNRKVPREALVCQSWLDNSKHSSEDPTAHFTVTNLSGIRDLHATYSAMKMIHCSQCGMCSPGFEGDFSECITVMENGNKTRLNNPLLIETLKRSQILSNSGVKLASGFESARVFKNETITGVCTECSRFCEVDGNGVVTLIHQNISNSQEEPSQGTSGSQGPIDDNISNINPYSVENLMALDVFQDQASHEYAMFMDTLTQAEKLVLSPIHAVIVILRSRTNNVPFSRHGSISFQLQKPVQTRALPWHTFQQLPFVVMVSSHEDGRVEEAKVNMSKIVRAKELMEREVACPVYGTKRSFYRYCDKIHTPFTVAAMETLASQLSETNAAVQPDGLRKINVNLIHERAQKRLNPQLFCEWLNSGFTIGSGLKESFMVDKQFTDTISHDNVTKQLWDVLNGFVRSRILENTDNFDNLVDSIQITPTDVMRCSVEKGWLNPNNDVCNASQQILEDVLLPEDEMKNLIFLCCEEIELLLRESSNDEGSSNSVAQGGVSNVHTENPEEILRKGIRNTVLERIPAPQIDRQRPVPESTPGYLQMAFPDVFLTGDGCPHQQHPRNITNVSENYLFHYYKWVSQQPRAMVNTELQFLLNSMIKRQHSKGKAKLALRSNTFDQGEIPVKEDLMKNAQLRDWTASNLMMFKSSIPDSTPFWKRSRDDSIAVQRDWEETVPWRPDKTSMSIMLFQTRAPPYNHHPAIHHLCPDAERHSKLSDEEFLEGRRRNVLQFPSIISFMCALMAELDTKFVSQLRYSGDSFFTRFEWGANANPHAHRLLFSQDFSDHMNTLKQRINTCIETHMTEALDNNQDLGSPLVQEAIHAKVLHCWDGARQDYIEYMRPFYTNWNAGLLADGQTKTFDFIYERKSTICRLDMASVIDQALTTGHFLELDTVYVSVVNGTCRHMGHSGINGQPSKNDKCAVIKKKRVKTKVPGKKEYKDVVTCKRRKPHLISNKPTIEQDPHNKKLVQLQFESNDKWFNGHDPFEILHLLSNADDKAVVPEFLRKPPTMNVSSKTDEDGKEQWNMNVNFFCEVGDSATEYVTKYAFKDVVNNKTSSEVLVTAMENLQDKEQINQGTVQKMYNSHAVAGTTSIFQATHLNIKLPLVISNVNIKHCSLCGLSLLRNDYDQADGEDYLIPPLIKLFDARHDDSIICKDRGKLSRELKKEIQSDMCLHQFCDLYDVQEMKNDEGGRNLLFKKRGAARLGRFNALKLIPCHGLKVANPNNKLHWHYCRTLCLWKIPCHKTTDLTPVGEDDETIKKGWINLFNKTFVDGSGLPPWAYKFWKHYNLPRSNDSDVSSSSEDEQESEHVAENDMRVTDNNNGLFSNCSGEDLCIPCPVSRPANEQFYQNPVDRMRAAPQADAQEVENDNSNMETFPVCDADVLANPEGADFMNLWIGDRVLPTTSEIHAQLRNLINAEGTISSDSFDASTLNEKQRIAHDMVVEYVKSRIEWDENGCEGPPPPPLRLVLMGNPGTGKSWTLKCLMSTLTKVIGTNTDEDGNEKPAWRDKIKLAAPTGAASSQMHFKAETLHRLFCIPIHLVDENLRLEENSAAYARLLLNFDPKKFTLLIVDEFSMVSRQMFAFITERLMQCNIDLDRIGIVFFGDPAQILPIGSDPLWSARLYTDQGKDCSSISILGMSRFREIFNFPPLQNIQGYQKCQGLRLSKDRITSDDVTGLRKRSMQGDFNAIFLTEVKRTNEDPISKEFTGKILVNLRYGSKCREKEIQFLRKHCPQASEIIYKEEWKTANVIHGYHFHSKDHANRASVEADNARALIRHHEATGNPIMRIDSMHQPAEKEGKLKNMSAKEFEGAPAKWHACKDMKVMLLRNIAPSIGLYNGSVHKLVGPIYSNDSVEVSLTLDHLKSAVIDDCVTTMPIDTCGKEKQIPPRSVLLSIDSVPYEKNMIDLLHAKVQMQCKFQFPRNPPVMPDFMVIEASNYTGPNILKLRGCDNYVPIAPVESYKPNKSKSRTSKEITSHTRISLPLEGGDAATGFKGQGATFSLAEVDLDGWFHVPGMFLVAISRVKSPTHLHIRVFPNYMDLKLQRLKENVLDAQAFEECMRVKSEWLYRHREDCQDAFWNGHTNQTADIIIEVAVSNGLSIRKDQQELLERVQMLCEDVNAEIISSTMQKLIQTSEYLVSEKAPHLSQQDYNILLNYQKKKSVKTNITKEKRMRNVLPSTSGRDKSKASKVQSYLDDIPVPKENILALKTRPDIERETFKGLQNSGKNVCFINAAIIALCHTACFDLLLRQYHDVHKQCTGNFGNVDPCPLCAVYEIMNRAYRHHKLDAKDLPKMPIMKLTKSLLPGWHLGMEHDADEFMTKLLEHLDNTVGCEINKGNVKITEMCKNCSIQRVNESHQCVRIPVRLTDFIEEEICIQEGINMWLSGDEQVLTCKDCGKTPHSVQPEIIDAPELLIVNIHRDGRKKTLTDYQISINEQTFVFRSSINYHPHHYTSVGCPGQDHYVFYSDEDIQTCHGSLSKRTKHHMAMNRVKTPLADNATVLIYELQMRQ